MSNYYSELNGSLRDGQILVLHGDSYTGGITTSLDQRLKEIVKSVNYSISEAVFDSAEAMSVVFKKHSNQTESASLETFSYEPVANLISQKIQHQKIWFGSFRNFLFNFFAVFADFSRDLIRSFVGFWCFLVF